MSQLMSHVEYLSKEIGPRPAGTEEERQAALYITEQIQKETGFAASIEDFASSSNVEAALAVLSGVTVLATIFAIVFPVLVIPAFILAAAAAIVYSLELFDRPTVSRVLSRGASQNVVAKYQPGIDEPENRAGRRPVRSRKIVLIAHYDTGRVTPPLVERFESSGLPIALICVVAMIAAAFFLLLRIFVAPGGGMGLLVLNVLGVLAAIVCLVPIVRALLSRSAPYNEGATNNATGVAAMLEVARRIARGSVSEADLADAADGSVTIHGEAAAIEAGLVPEGVQLRYEAEQLEPPSELGEYSEEERIRSAKAAIAALTGQPVERRVFSSVADNLVNSRAGEASEGGDAAVAVEAGAGGVAGAGAVGADATADGFESAGAAAAAAVAAATAAGAAASEPAAGFGGGASAPATADGFENAPSWFVAAQQNAKKSERFNADEAPQVRRSRYTEAMEYAERERRELEEEALAAERAEREAALRIREEEARAALAASAAEPVAEPVAEPEVDEEAAGGADVVQAASADRDVSAIAQGPDGTVAMPAHVPAVEVLAEAGLPEVAVPAASAEPEAGARDRIAGLPSIEPAPASAPEPTTSPSRSGILRNLRANVPSLSGIISPVKADTRKGEGAAATSAGSANRAAARRAVASVPAVEQPAQQAQPQVQPLPQVQAEPDLVPSAATASSSVSASAANAADSDPGASRPSVRSSAKAATADAASSARRRETVEVPRSRSGNLLNRLKKNSNDDLSDTPQHWLDVDDDFEARSVGRARGSWESFRDDQYFDDDDGFGDFMAGDERPRSSRRWQGGAYSGRVQVGHADTRSDANLEAEVSGVIPIDEEDLAISEEIEQIYHFRNPQFSTEIWFVAMGADGTSHDGARAFIEEHRDELRGSMIIEIESLGAGALSVASEEGRVRKVQASSRVKRYTRNATAATGLALDTVSLAGTDSISSTLQKAGFQTMHVFGAENGRPALKGSADDVLENVDEMLLDEHLNYVFELLKH